MAHIQRQLYSFKVRSTSESGAYVDRDALLVIDDENDNIPQLSRASYSVEIREDVYVGTEILHIKWTDKDFSEWT